MIPPPQFFPGNLLLLEKADVFTIRENAQAVQLEVNADLTRMKCFPYSIWRTNVAARYAADPIVMELLNILDVWQNGTPSRIPRNHAASLLPIPQNDSQPWTSFFS